MKLAAICVGLLVLCAPPSGRTHGPRSSTLKQNPAHEKSVGCSAVYENHNQIDYGPLKVRMVTGTNVIGSQDEIFQRDVPGACFSLFTEDDNTFISSTISGPDGRFRFQNLKPGRYRLVARLAGLCTANVPIDVSPHHKKAREILLRFMIVGIDVCSYGELIPADGSRSRRP